MTNKPSLLRQLIGAVVGSAIALAGYYSFKFATPIVTAYVTLPPAERQHDLGDVRVNGDMSETQLARQAARNERLANSIETNEPEITIEPDENWKDEWPEEIKTTEPTATETPAPVETDDGWEDFLRDAAPAEQEKTAAKNSVTTHSSAPALPDSGFGVVAVMITSIGAAIGAKRRSRQK